MGEYENEIRAKITKRYGSIPKMANATGIPKNTIYHALERGMDNTTTRTRHQILDALEEKGKEESSVPESNLTPDEQRLVDLYRSVDPQWRDEMLSTLANFARRHPLNQGVSVRSA